MSFRRCIDEAVARGEIGPDVADRARRTYDGAYANASEAFGPNDADRAAADAVMRDLEAESVEAERRRAMMVRARTSLLEGVAAYKKARGYQDPSAVGPRRRARGGGGAGRPPEPPNSVDGSEVPSGYEGGMFARALELIVENMPGLAGAPFPSIEGRYRAIRGQVDAMMADLIERFETRSGMDAPNRAQLNNIVREAFGEASSDPTAKAMSHAWSEAAEHLRLMFNAAGGSIRKLEGWGLPQAHDAYAVRQAGRDAWVAYVLPRLDRARMLDTATGQPLSEAGLRAALDEVWESIASLGASAREVGENLGHGALAKRRSDARFLVFRNADDWIAYQQTFGDGDPFSVMMGHLDEMARDIAQMQILGPNPAAQWSWLKQAALREALLEEAAGVKGAADRAKGLVRTADNMLDYFTGSLSTPINSKLASFGVSARAYLTSVQLGGAILSDIPAAPLFGALARTFAGLSKKGDLARFATLITPTGGAPAEVRRMARRSGFIVEQATDALIRATQDNLRLLTVGERLDGGLNAFARRLPAAVLRMQGLTGYTAARKRSFRFEFMGALADRSGRTLSDLAAGDAEDRAFADLMKARGFTEDDWSAIRATAAWEPQPGATFLRPTDIADRELSLRVAEMIEMETRFAVPETSVWTRAKLLGESRPGTVAGEVRRSWAMFRSFTLTAAHLYAEELSLRGGRMGLPPFMAGAAGMSGLFVWLTLAGAATIQMRALAAGDDPRRMDDPEFWANAVLHGGGLWMVGDFIFSAEQRGASQLESFGPVGGAVGDAYDATLGNAVSIGSDLTDGAEFGEAVEDANLGKDAVSLVRHYTPGANIWWMRAAWNRALVDQVQVRLDPEAEEEFARTRRRLERDRGQGQWWSRAEPLPKRTPEVSPR